MGIMLSPSSRSGFRPNRIGGRKRSSLIQKTSPESLLRVLAISESVEWGQNTRAEWRPRGANMKVKMDRITMPDYYG